MKNLFALVFFLLSWGCSLGISRSEFYGNWKLTESSVDLLTNRGIDANHFSEMSFEIYQDRFEFDAIHIKEQIFHHYLGSGDYWVIKNNFLVIMVNDNNTDAYLYFNIEKHNGEVQLVVYLGDPDNQTKLVYLKR